MKTCKWCRAPFTSKRSTHAYCSADCRLRQGWLLLERRRKRERNRCKKCARLACRKVFWTRMTRRVFCSTHCKDLSAQQVRYQCRKFEAEIARKEIAQ